MYNYTVYTLEEKKNINVKMFYNGPNSVPKHNSGTMIHNNTPNSFMRWETLYPYCLYKLSKSMTCRPLRDSLELLMF